MTKVTYVGEDGQTESSGACADRPRHPLVLLGALGFVLNTALLAAEKRLVGRGRTTTV
ncbi:hypothetical protein ACFQ6S_14805 [Streptomyces sp. NPDC056479]|uniref:hypothetical protein n=1 Tax=Streptomyces sp. NPDC056479 TaxID=3345832 RepID=UPI00368474E4